MLGNNVEFFLRITNCVQNLHAKEKLHSSSYLNMDDENITKAEYSSQKIVRLVQSNDDMPTECHVANNDEHMCPS